MDEIIVRQLTCFVISVPSFMEDSLLGEYLKCFKANPLDVEYRRNRFVEGETTFTLPVKPEDTERFRSFIVEFLKFKEKVPLFI